MIKIIFFYFLRNKYLSLLGGFLLAFLIIPQKANGSHAMALDLTYKCISGNEYEFTLTFYRDCQGIPAPASPTLHIQSASCGIHTHIDLNQIGNPLEVSAICNSQISNTNCNGGTLPGVQKYTYIGTYTLPVNCPDWVFSYTECCRNNLITNLSSKNNIYIEATLDNSVFSGNSSPQFSTLPVPYICSGQLYSYNHGITDSDGDSLVYSLISPLQGKGNPIGHSAGYSASKPIHTTIGSVEFNATTGQMDLIPDGDQVCVVAVQVKEYRNGIVIGTTMRDMQVIVTNCSNTIPYIKNEGSIRNHSGGMLVSKNQIEVCPGEVINFDLVATDDDGDNLIMSNNLINVIQNASFITTSVTSSLDSAHFSWTPTMNDLGLYTFAVSIKDDACQISGSQAYSYSIHVLPGTSAGPDKFYCSSGGPVQLKAIGGTVFNWTMLDGSPAIGLSCTNCADPIASPSLTSTYVVTSNFSSNCKNKDTITVFSVADFDLSASGDTNLCSYKEGVQIGVTAGPDNASLYTYSWTPAQSLSEPTSATTIAKPPVTTQYFIEVTSPNGCQRRTSLMVEVKNVIDLSILPGDSIETCDSIKLDLLMEPIGEIFREPFDHEIDSSNWSGISGGNLSATCGSFSEDAYYMNGTTFRSLSTKDLDVQTGGVVNFYIKAGFCNQCICDKPENDEQDENLYLEYSIDGGTTWIPWEIFDADIFSPKTSFEYIQLTIPDGAKTASTRFRWNQLNHLLDKDVWILDNISIKEGLGDYTYLWTPAHTLTDATIKNPTAFPSSTTTYYVTATDINTGCVYTDSIKVKFKEEFEVIAHPSETYCPDDPAFKLQVNIPNGNIYTYQWYPNTNISDPTVQNPEVTPNVSTIYAVVITDPSSGCYRRQEIFVTVPPRFNVTTPEDSSVCLSHSLPLSASVDIADNYDYLWRPIAGLSDQAVPNPIAKPNVTTEYIVFVKNKNTGCTKSDTVNIKVFPDFNLETTGTTTLCPDAAGVDIEASASPGTNYTYHWDTNHDITDPSSSSQFVKPSSDTTYQLLVHRTGGCWKRDSVRVEIYDDVLDLKASNDTLIHEGDYAFLNASGAMTYAWKQGIRTLDSSEYISVAPLTKTPYWIYGSDACYTDSAEVVVDVVPIDFFIPNLITPNGDNLNETFKITNFGKRWNLEIYNRWGKLVYKKDQYIEGWKGENEQEGIFYYHITDSKTDKTYEGWIQIVR